LPEFFGIFFGPREVGGTDDFNFEFGFTELETAGDVVPVGRDDLGGMQGSTAHDVDKALVSIEFRTAVGPIRITQTDIELFDVDIAGLSRAISFIR
jgi:hypothetical protein